MEDVIKFEYKELGNKDRVRSYTLELEEGAYIFKIRKENKTFSLPKHDVEEIFKKYDFKNLTVDVMYPFRVKDQIDYRIKITFKNHEILDFNGYSHYPEFYNDFISDIAKLIPGRSCSSLKVKDEMLDKDTKYITNYVEKVSIYSKCGELIISKDRLTEDEYDVDVSVDKLNKFFKKNDLNFVLPINVHYFTYLFNKKADFAENSNLKKGDLEYYIDVRLHNKKHRYYDLNDEKILKSLGKLIDYLKIYSNLPLFEAFINEDFINIFLTSHNIPKTKAQVNEQFEELLSKGNTLIDTLKIVAKDNLNYSMYELISLAYQNQDYYYVYQINKNFDVREYIVNAEHDKELSKYFKSKDFSELGILYLNKDYDAIYYVEKDTIFMALVSAKYEDLKFLKLKESLKEELIRQFKETLKFE